MSSIISQSAYMDIYFRRPEVTEEEKEAVCDHVVTAFHQFSRQANSKRLPLEDVLAELSHRKMGALFWGVNQCNCCVRHRASAPIAFDSEEETEAKPNAVRGCMCHCRMVKRFLHRAYLVSKEIPEDAVTEPAESESDEELVFDQMEDLKSRPF